MRNAETPSPVTNCVTSTSYHWPEETLPRGAAPAAPAAGADAHVTLDSFQPPPAARTSPPEEDGLTQKRRSLALVILPPPTPVTTNLKSELLSGLPSTSNDG